MDTAESQVEEERDKLSTYRLGILLGLGLPLEDAELISEDHTIYLHDVRRLLQRGCPEHLLGKIVL